MGRQNLDIIAVSSTFPTSDFIWGSKTSILLMFQVLFSHQILYRQAKPRYDWCFKYISLIRFYLGDKKSIWLMFQLLSLIRFYLGRQKVDLIDVSSTFPSSDFIWGDKTSIWLMFQVVFLHQVLFGETKSRYDWCFKYFSFIRFYLGR